MMTKAGIGGRQQCNNGSSKCRQWLVMKPPESSGQQLAVKAASNDSIDGRMTACDDESGWRRSTTQQSTNNGSSKGQVVAGVETTLRKWLMLGVKCGRQGEC
jgi:hypothetical protein